MYARVLIGCVNYTMDARTTVRNYAVNPLLYDPFYDSSLSLSLSFFFYFPLDEEFRLSDGGNVTTSVRR